MKRKAPEENSENQPYNFSATKRNFPGNHLVLHEIVLNIPNIFKRQSSNNIVEWELDVNNNYVERITQTAPPVIKSVDSSTQTPYWSNRSEVENLRARLRALKESNRQLMQIIVENGI